jgi:hypothetical protein
MPTPDPKTEEELLEQAKHLAGQLSDQRTITLFLRVVVGIRSRNGKNRTLSYREWSQRSEFTMFNTLVLAPNVVSGEIDVFPAER